jgi:hypothetical protein
MQATTTDVLYVTLLPRSANGNRLTFTALFTPHFATAKAYNGMQNHWEQVAAKCDMPWTFTLQKQGPNGAEVASCAVQAIPKTFNRDVWKGIFHSKLGFAARAASPRDRYKNAWILSHDATDLHIRHDLYRGFHLHRQFLRNKSAAIAATNGNLIASKIRENAALAVYIPPVIADPDGPPMGDLLAQRTEALQYRNRSRKNFGSPGKIPADLLYTRIDHAVDLLESGGQMLSAPALYALYRHCVESALVAGLLSQQTPNKELNGYVAAINAKAKGTVTVQGYLVEPDAADANNFPQLDSIQDYMEFHLFAHPDKISCQASDDPEFHQLMGLMHQYPALLRPLGLAVDFEDVEVIDANSRTAYQVLHGPLLASVKPSDETRALISEFASLQPLFTCCDVGSGFAASSLPQSRLGAGFVHLVPQVFSLITADTDGTSHKLVQQTQAASSIEHATNAPAGFHNCDLIETEKGTFALSKPDPLNKVPSSRTVGLSLYQSDRDDVLAKTLARTATGSTTDPFFADDLTLGYRMDVQQGGNKTWLSLHERESWYDIRLDNHHVTWKPTDQKYASVRDADEGFITLAATQTDVKPSPDQPADPTSLQVQVHQALVTWNGWSLSVPNPEKPYRGTRAQPASTCGPSGEVVTVTPTFKLAGKGMLPKLKFGEFYEVRLRQVDLAGNSVSRTAKEPDGYALPMDEGTHFARHEPIRAPHVLLEKPIHRNTRPSEHIDRLVLRDGGEHTTRLLVPPRETRRLADLHGLINGTRPGSAFEFAVLVQETGAFPKVSETTEFKDTFADSAENNDAIFIHGKTHPTLPYYPDPMARLLRIDAFWLRPDLASYQKINTKPIYLSFFNDTAVGWTDVVPVRILLEKADGPPSLNVGWTPLIENHPETLPGIPSLTVKLPAGDTVLIQATCCAAAESGKENLTPMAAFRTFGLESTKPKNTKPPEKSTSAPALDNFPALRSLYLSKKALNALHKSGPAAPDYNSLVTSMTSEDLLTGGLHTVTPPQRLTLVHATSQPLAAPTFQVPFSVQRTYNISAASVSGSINAHWNSTGKITIEASWSDIIDDGKTAQLRTQQTREVPFEIVNSGGGGNEVCGEGVVARTLNTAHSFRDTRARWVNYSLTASTRFREYFPDATKPDTFLRMGESHGVQVQSSSIPPVVSPVYILPAFGWGENTSAALQRKQVLRVYLNRPFMISGDHECVGVVLAPNDKQDCNKTPCSLVTRWGGDPFDPSSGLSKPFMSAQDFSGASDHLQTGCTLQEDGIADVLPFTAEFAEERGLWFCDIGINQLHASSAFVRLALVRWQPHGMPLDTKNKVPDCRLSQVVIADFMQIRSDRSVSVQRTDKTDVVVTLSGVFPGAGAAFHTKILYTVEQRWHSVGRDMGWRPVGASAEFKPPDGTKGYGEITWTAAVPLAKSIDTHKYRLLIEEFETDGKDFNRCIYVHYVEL